MEIIILRRHVEGEDGTVLVASHGENKGKPYALSVEVADVTPKEAEEVHRDPSVDMAVLGMPVYAIEPLEAGPSEPTEPPQISWGIEAVKADQSPYTGAGVIVAVLDTGINREHPAFEGVNIIEENFTTGGAVDDTGHGTHCAGIIFGRDTSGCRIGIARGIKQALIGKVFGPGGGTTGSIVRALHWALQKEAHVISMSLGMDFTRHREYLKATFGHNDLVATSVALAGYRDNLRMFDRLSRAIGADQVMPRGTIVVVAAGNESRRPEYVISAGPPADAENFLSVGALGPGAEGKYVVAPFSNIGARFAAPGEHIWSTSHKGGGLIAKSGTSMAAPHVAGVAALWAEKLMEGGVGQASAVIDTMKRSAIALRHIPDRRDVGAGLVQAPLSA